MSDDVEAIAPRVRLAHRDGRWRVYHLYFGKWRQYGAYRSEKRARRVAARRAREQFEVDQRVGRAETNDADIRRIIEGRDRP